MLENTPLGSGCLTGIPEKDLRAADGLVASVHVTATRPAASTPQLHFIMQTRQFHGLRMRVGAPP
jgi:hypothetical protein